MMTSKKIKGLMLSSGLMALTLTGPAMALDAEAFADRIASIYKQVGYDLDFGPASVQGTTVTIDGVTVSLLGLTDSMTFDTVVTFTGVKETKDGGFVADTMSVPDIDTQFNDPALHLTLRGLEVSDIYLPPPGEADALDMMQLSGRFATGPLVLARGGAELFAYDSMETLSHFNHDSAGLLTDLRSSFVLDGIRVDLPAVFENDPQVSATINTLDLGLIEGRMIQDTQWTVADGHFVLESFLIDFPALGAIDLKFDISGFTPELLDKIYTMQATALDGLPTEATEAQMEEIEARQMMVGMEILQKTTLTSASLRYDEVALAGKVLDLIAAQTGVQRAQFVETLISGLPAMIDQAGSPALSEIAVPALSAFLQNPQSLEVSVRPADPAPLLVLTAAAANPSGLVAVLGLEIAANQASTTP